MDSKLFGFLKLDGLIDSVKGYVDARIQLLKLDLQEKASGIATSLLFIALIAFCSIMMLIFSSLALGHLLNTLLKSSYLGFALMALLYLLLMIVLGLNITKGFLHRRVKNILLAVMGVKKVK